ncbi:MAG TPA: hypothetical protein VLI69_05315 [Gammaproteobacteria bacterium]|nr:hypothetical protein [Gammaproteobacteria bacterium]
MRLYQIGFLLSVFVFLTPVFANECPPVEKVSNFQRISGWSEKVFYTDQGKSLAFDLMRVEKTAHGRQISCYYSYFDPEMNKLMPPALMLRTVIR